MVFNVDVAAPPASAAAIDDAALAAGAGGSLARPELVVREGRDWPAGGCSSELSSARTNASDL
jgi:hypothetical protein